MRRSTPSGPRGVLEVDWPFFGEICRALALRVARDYQPEIVLGVAKAGVIPFSWWTRPAIPAAPCGSP
jgi:hypothetical protein